MQRNNKLGALTFRNAVLWREYKIFGISGVARVWEPVIAAVKSDNAEHPANLTLFGHIEKLSVALLGFISQNHLDGILDRGAILRRQIKRQTPIVPAAPL